MEMWCESRQIDSSTVSARADTHIRIILLALVIWGRGIRLQHQLLDGTLHENGENTELTLRGNLGQLGIPFPQPNGISSVFRQLQQTLR